MTKIADAEPIIISEVDFAAALTGAFRQGWQGGVEALADRLLKGGAKLKRSAAEATAVTGAIFALNVRRQWRDHFS